jgi:hypothetical protein
MDSDLDTLATALYARIDDTLKARPELQPWRPKIGIAPKLSDAELLMALIEIPQVCLPSTTRLLTIGDEMHRYTRERWYTARAGAAAHGDAHGLNANGHINRRLVPRSEEPPTRDRGDTEVGHNHHRSADTHDVTASCCPNWRVTSSRDSCPTLRLLCEARMTIADSGVGDNPGRDQNNSQHKDGDTPRDRHPVVCSVRVHRWQIENKIRVSVVMCVQGLSPW